MLNINNVEKVYLAVGITDLRKSIDGLSVIVSAVFNLDVYNNAIYVFCNRNKNKIKILHWENGFWLYYYRLEKGRLKWPTNDYDTVTVSLEEFRWILQGYEARTVNKLKVKKDKNFY